jgi:hypothetical protein
MTTSRTASMPRFIGAGIFESIRRPPIARRVRKAIRGLWEKAISLPGHGNTARSGDKPQGFDRFPCF